LAVGDSLRITKNFHAGGRRFRNNELCTVTAIDRDSITFGDGRVIKRSGPVHVDQGIAVTSHASQGKSVDQVIVSVPIAAFSQANEVQFYVSIVASTACDASLHRFEGCAERGGDAAK
jgi:hypothetical protein